MLSRALWTAYLGARGLARPWAELDRFRDLDAEGARREMGERLLRQVSYFGGRADALDPWREAAARWRTVDDLWAGWSSLPIVGKSDLQTRFRPSQLERLGVEGVASATGGSTGEPTPYLHDRAMLRAATATRLYARTRQGWRPGMPTICVWGSDRDVGRAVPRRARLSAWLRNDLVVGGYRLDDSTVDAVLGHVRRHRECAIYGFTSMLELVAREVVRRGEQLSRGAVRTAWNGGEMLFDTQSEVFEAAFGVPILNTYGGRELSALAYQPARDRPLLVLRPFVTVEVLDDQGREVDPGRTGRLVWTSTVCRGTPFLRYDSGDLGSYSASGKDASGVRALEAIHGRHAGTLDLGDGRALNCLVWNHLFKEFHEVTQFQIAFHGRREVELRLRGESFRPERERILLETAGRLVAPLPVRISRPADIPRTSRGKLVQVVQEP